MIRQRLCTLTLGFLIGVGAEASTVTDLSVTVKIKGSGDPLAGATVVASESSYAETDGQGQVVLIGVEVPTQVKVLAAGFETLRVDLTEGAPITVYLIPHAYQADGLEVIEERVQEKVSKVVLSAEELKRAPGTGGDAVKVVQSLPGVVNAGEGTGLM